MTSQPGYQTIVIQILPNISRSKGNQTLKFGQLKKHEKHFSCDGETSPRPFSEKLKLSISLNQ